MERNVALKKGIVVFALPGEPGLAELVGDFKIQFQDRQGDFYWLVKNTYFVWPPFFSAFHSLTRIIMIVLWLI